MKEITTHLSSYLIVTCMLTIIENFYSSRYAEFRNPHDHPDPSQKYKRPLIYWHILAARLAFIVVYQNLVTFVMTVVEWTIPDISRKLNDRIKREAYRTNEIIIKNEMERAKFRNKHGGRVRMNDSDEIN